MNERELKPCPFCGGKAKLVTKNHVGGMISVYATCKNCFSKTKEMIAAADYCANDEITKIWNQREIGEVVHECKTDLHARNASMAHRDEFICTNCGINLQNWEAVECYGDDTVHYTYAFRYCPNCGAKIDESEDRQK